MNALVLVVVRTCRSHSSSAVGIFLGTKAYGGSPYLFLIFGLIFGRLLTLGADFAIMPLGKAQ